MRPVALNSFAQSLTSPLCSLSCYVSSASPDPLPPNKQANLSLYSPCQHSSIVLGWLDSHSLNVAFPEPSLRGQNLINIIPSKMSLLSFIEALDKYSTRGYRLVTADKGGSVKVKKEGTVQGRAFGDQKQGLTEEELRDITRRMGWSVEIA